MRFACLRLALLAVSLGGFFAADAAAVYNPSLGQFAQRDPAGYVDGMNNRVAHHVMHGGVDPSGRKLVINRLHFEAGSLKELFVKPLDEAFRALCPCLDFTVKKMELDAPWRWRRTEQMYVINAKLPKDMSWDEFDCCLYLSWGGCNTIWKLHQSSTIVRLNFTSRGYSGARHWEASRRDRRKSDFVDVHWNQKTERPAGNAVIGRESLQDSSPARRDRLNAAVSQSTLAHEMQHAVDMVENEGDVSRRLIDGTTGAETEDPRVGTFEGEVRAIRLENQIFEELTGRAGERTNYRRSAKVGVSLQMVNPKVFQADVPLTTYSDEEAESMWRALNR